MNSNHKAWLDSEYRQWVEALGSSTVWNFKENPMVKRMLGEVEWPEELKLSLSAGDRTTLRMIDNIGRVTHQNISGACWRMVYYARKVLERKPSSVVEIGGGVGQFFAVMRALGYQGDYWIADIDEVQAFQRKYLREVAAQTGLHTEQVIPKAFDMCVSFYALGEFDDGLKDWYVKNVVSKCQRGFVIWNPHSGATAEIPFECSVQDEYPLTAPGNKQLEW